MAYIDSHRDRFGVEPILHALEVAPSTYYCTKSRPPSKRSLSDAVLKPRILQLWTDNYAVYGVRKLTKALRREGVVVGRDQVGRLMAELGIAGMVRGQTDHQSRSHRRPCPRPGHTPLRRLRAQPSLGVGLHLCGLLVGDGLHGLHRRRLLPSHRRMEGRHDHAHRSRPRRPGDGHLAQGQRPQRPGGPFRRGQPVHVAALHRTPGRDRGGSFDRHGRGLI